MYKVFLKKTKCWPDGKRDVSGPMLIGMFFLYRAIESEYVYTVIRTSFTLKPVQPVSYTHLDVYKRQVFICLYSFFSLYNTKCKTILELSLIHI